MRRLLWPAVSTLLMLAVLLSLGAWQLQRLAWKQDILRQIAQAEALPAIDLPANPSTFAKVRLVGRFGDHWALYGSEGRDTAAGPVLGAQLLGVLQRPGGVPVLVMLGWVPGVDVHPPAGPAVVEGFIRPGETAGWFAATDNPMAGRYYTLNPTAIGAGLGYAEVAPYVLVAMAPQAGGSQTVGPQPARNLPRPPNDHFGYALTWFSFAVILLVIFGLHARKVLRA